MIAAIWVPDFCLQAWIRLNPGRNDSALGLIESSELRGVARIIALNNIANQHGIKPGMTVSQAQAIFEGIKVVARCPQAEADALTVLRDALWGRTPQVRVEHQDLGWAYAGTRGMERLFGRVEEWMQAVLNDLSLLGLRGFIGAAPGWQQARLLALSGGGLLADASHGEALLAMPCSVLEPSHELGKLFLRLGIESLGDFLKIESDDVLEHMGEEAFLKHQIVRGEEPAGPMAFERYEPVFAEEKQFEEALADLNALFFVLQPMLSRLLSRLSIRGFYCRSVNLIFSYDGAGSEERTIEPGCPTRSARVLLELCRLDLERCPPSESVGLIRILAEPAKVQSSQLDLFRAEHGTHEKISLTLARLEGILGKGHVGSPKFTESYREDVFELVPFCPKKAESSEPQAMPASLCLRRLRPPQEAVVMCKGATFVHFSVKGFAGRIRQWHGPYRVCTEWWNEHVTEAAELEIGFFGDLYDLEVRDRIYRVCWNHRRKYWLALGWYD